MSSENPVFLSDLFTVIVEIESCLAKVSYKFTSKEDFSKLDSIEEIQLVYWSEIIQRLHISGATTILRLKKVVSSSG